MMLLHLIDAIFGAYLLELGHVQYRLQVTLRMNSMNIIELMYKSKSLYLIWILNELYILL